jgi:hypothetical protein
MNVDQNQNCDNQTEAIAREITQKDIEFKSFIGYERKIAQAEMPIIEKKYCLIKYVAEITD